MTINQLLENCRVNAVKRTNEYYKEICDGVCDIKEEIENDKITGEYYKDLERFTFDEIYKLIRKIRNTKLMSADDKAKAIEIIHKCPEYIKTENDVAKIFVDHFKRNVDLYRTM